MVTSFHKKPPDNVEAIGSYIFRYGYGVMGSKLERKTSTSILHCNHFCLKNSKCVSFNYQLTGNSHGSCELSGQGVVSREESDGVLEDIPGCIFVQTVRQDLKPRSCLDLLQAGRRYSGIYTLFDDNGSLFPVYCDLTSEPKAAWTLFMSERTPGSHMFQRKPLFQDYPTNDTNPNWSAFRLPLFNMMQLRSRTTHWRITCSFQIDGLVYQDYVRAKTRYFDLIDIKGSGRCRPVEYINVRGHSCSHCQTIWFQSSQEILHLDSSSKRCDFDPSPGAVHTEDNFGYYMSFSPKFRCTDPGRESTTNHWFGGYLID